MKARKALIPATALLAALAVLVGNPSRPRTDALHVVSVGRNPLNLAVDPRAGHVFVVNYNDGSGPGTVDMLDATNGMLRRAVPVGMFPRGIIVDERRGRAVVMNTAAPWVSAPASVSILDTRSGREQRRVSLGATPSALALDPTTGHVLVGLQNGRVQTLEAATGRLVGTVTVGFTPRGAAVDGRHRRIFLIGFRPGGAGRVAMLDMRDGRVLGIRATGAAPSLVAVDTRQGHVFVGNLGRSVRMCVSSAGSCRMYSTVTMLDARTGRMLRAIMVGQNPSSLVVDEQTQRAFVVNRGDNREDSGTVSVLDTRTGRVVRTTRVGYAPSDAAIDRRRRHVYVTNGNGGTVSVLDARDGRFLGTLHVIGDPLAIVADERTDRVFVSSAGGSTAGSMPYTPGGRTVFDRVGFLASTIAQVVEVGVLHQGRSGMVSVLDATR